MGSWHWRCGNRGHGLCRGRPGLVDVLGEFGVGMVPRSVSSQVQLPLTRLCAVPTILLPEMTPEYSA